MSLDESDQKSVAENVDDAAGVPDEDLIDRVRNTTVGKSIIRSPRRVTPRDRAAGHWSNFLLHIYPVKIRKR
ncbi:MAG: hypothetical protein DRJ50_10695, partial [Actinobacteria bacterium]